MKGPSVSGHHNGPVYVSIYSGSNVLSLNELEGISPRFQLVALGKATSIQILDPLSDARWDNFIARHPNSSVFHQKGWLETLARTYRYTPLVFTTARPGDELKNGLVVCQVASWITGNRVVSLPFSDHCEPVANSDDDMKALICESQSALRGHGWRYLELRPIRQGFSEMARDLKFQPTGRFWRHVMDLRPDFSDLFRSFHKSSIQRRVKHADASGLVEKCGTTPELLRAFYHMLVLTRSRHNLPPAPFDWFQNLVECQGKALEIRVAYKDAEPMAAILTLRFRQTAYFKYGASDARFNRFGATPWLLWRAIQAAKSSGALRFDFGRTQADNPGLLAFKNHWVPRCEPLTYWRYPGADSEGSSGDWKVKTAKRVFSHLPLRLLVISGKLIYRHIG
jgi:hypothetical protein